MTEAAFIRYLAAMSQCHVLLEKGLINGREFQLFEEKMRVKYNLSEKSIFRDYRLLSEGK